MSELMQINKEKLIIEFNIDICKNFAQADFDDLFFFCFVSRSQLNLV